MDTVIDADFDCRTCGACCLDGRGPGREIGETWIGVTARDAQRLPTDKYTAACAVVDYDVYTMRAQRLKILDGDEERTGCAALEGRPGRAVTCSVYEDRPEVCRAFEAGSIQCRDARRSYVELFGGDQIAARGPREAIAAILRKEAEHVGVLVRRATDDEQRAALEAAVAARRAHVTSILRLPPPARRARGVKS